MRSRTYIQQRLSAGGRTAKRSGSARVLPHERQMERTGCVQKRLFRSRQNSMIAGVCGGLADYFAIDPTLVRIGMVALIFFDGLGIVAYIVMALIVPEEWMKAASPAEIVEENIRDLAHTAQTIGERAEAVTANQQQFARVLGGAIVLLGVFLLLRNLNLMQWVDRRWMWPGVIIIGGLAMVLNGMRRR